MLESVAVLLLCQLAGELIVVVLGWPLPGPVVGMGLLFLGLVLRGGVPRSLADTASGLLAQLSLLFVPAGVGVMTHLTLLGSQWLPLTASLLISTLMTIAVTGWVMQRLSREGSESE
jgi:putative effector of murein hydrolase LrgA (UPF0299 family)